MLLLLVVEEIVMEYVQSCRSTHLLDSHEYLRYNIIEGEGKTREKMYIAETKQHHTPHCGWTEIECGEDTVIHVPTVDTYLTCLVPGFSPHTHYNV